MDSRALGQHIVHRFDDELEALRARVLSLGGLVEQQLEAALRAFSEHSGELAAEVVEGDSEVNELERVIDEECTRLLALRAPVAADLRLVIGVIKAVNDLERMGDESVRIAQMATRIVSRSGRPTRVSELRRLGARVQAMLRSSLDAFARTDLEAATRVVEDDHAVDREHESLNRELVTVMMEDPREIPRSMDVLFAARALERIGDRACNICEYVVYIVKGADVRHTGLAAMQSVVRSED